MWSCIGIGIFVLFLFFCFLFYIKFHAYMQFIVPSLFFHPVLDEGLREAFCEVYSLLFTIFN